MVFGRIIYDAFFHWSWSKRLSQLDWNVSKPNLTDLVLFLPCSTITYMLDTLSHRLKNKSNTATHIGAAQSPYPHWGTNLWFHLGCRTLELQYVTVWDNMALTGQDDVGRKIFRHQDDLKLWGNEMQWVAILIGFHKHKSKEPEASKSLKKDKELLICNLIVREEEHDSFILFSCSLVHILQVSFEVTKAIWTGDHNHIGQVLANKGLSPNSTQ